MTEESMPTRDESLDRDAERWQHTAEAKLLADVELCQYCGAILDPRKLAKSGRKRRQRYCDNKCASAARQARGFYHEISKQGYAAQMAYKAEHGKVPGYDNRVAVLRNPNRTNRRKKRKGTVERNSP